jgi:archaellin
MKKYFTLLLITILTATQTLKAQLDLVFISSFSSTSDNSVNHLTWTIAKNHGVKSIDVERSTNGTDFKTIAALMATEKYNTESYTYSDTIASPDIIMYRLKVLSKTQHVFYSKIVLVRSKMISNYGIKILGNPVNDKVSFYYNSKNIQQADIKVYSLSGNVVFNQKINSFIGDNLITIPLNSGFAPGMYVIEIDNGILTQTEKFIKR